MDDLRPWLALALLGAYHGLNPAMGWLFAVALGLQERSGAAVIRALAPIALGHAASVATVAALAGVAGALVAPAVLRPAGAALLMGYGLFRLLGRARHPRWVGMKVGLRGLAAWSFLMSTAHGSGLMLVPVLLRMPPGAGAAAAHSAHADPGPMADAAALGLAAVAMHTAAMLLVMGIVALLVYEKVGLAILRRGWLNLDRAWALVLVAAGAATMVLQ